MRKQDAISFGQLTLSGQGTGIKQTIPSGYLDPSQAGDGLISTYSAYDADSQLLASRDDNGNATASIYDNQGRTLVQRQALNLPGTTFTISGGDSGAFTQMVHGIATDPTNPAGLDTTTTYDRDGNVRTVTNQGDKTGIRSTTTDTVDALNRTTARSIVNPSGSTFVGTTGQSWQYDGLSRTTQEINTSGRDANQNALPNVTTSRFYDSLSRQIEEQQQIGTPPAPASVVSWNYDVAAAGSADGASALVYPDGRQLDSRYDALDRLTTRSDDGFSTNPIGTEQYLGPDREAVRSFQVNGNGGVRLTYIGLPSNPNVDVGYDGDQRVLRQAWETYTATTPLGRNTNAPVIGFSYQFADGTPAYDRNNNLLVAQKLHDPGNAEVYHYRSDNELTSFQRGTLDSSGSTIQTPTTTPGILQGQDWLATRSQPDHQAGLDGAGNWTNTSYTVGGQVYTDSRTVTEVNATHVVSGTPYGGGAAGTYVVDKAGNLLDDGQRLDYYDARNRLVEVSRKSDGTEIARYVYDADGRRVESVVMNGGATTTTTFAYAGAEVIQQQDSTGIELQFVYGDSGLWTLDNRSGGVTVAQLNDGQSNDQRLYYLTDPSGSVYGLVNKGGVLREAYQYDPMAGRRCTRPPVRAASSLGIRGRTR